MPLQMSAQINEISAAMAKAQGKIRGAKKDSDNPFFKSKYADLSSCYEACRDALCDAGVAVIQPTEDTDGTTVVVHTILAHSSGQWIAGTIRLKPTKPDPQGIGSAITYARRYGLTSMVGIATEDDDGGEASRPQKREAAPQTKPERTAAAGQAVAAEVVAKREERPASAFITGPQVVRFHSIKSAAGIRDEDAKRMLAEMGFGSSSEITVNKYEEACEKVRKLGGLVEPPPPAAAPAPTKLQPMSAILEKKIVDLMKLVNMSVTQASMLVGRPITELKELTQEEGGKLWGVLDRASKGDTTANEQVAKAIKEGVPF